MPDGSFFQEKKAAAVLKHGILGRYLRIFVSKVGSKSGENRVIYLDGYAGPGVYNDGKPGSPALAVSTAEKLAGLRNILGIYVEKNPKHARQLEEYLKTTDHDYVVLRGDLETRLEEALEMVGANDPLFAFFDPFGLGITFDRLISVLKHADFYDGFRHGPATEVLLNFSYAGLRRTAGHLSSSGNDTRYLKSRRAILNRLDAILGGDWWRPVWKSEGKNRIALIAAEYIKRVADSASAQGWYRVPVPQSIDGPIIYELMFLTHYPKEGLWNFNECVSLAFEDYYAFCTREELDLHTTVDRAAKWVQIIKDNIKQLVNKHGKFSVWEHLQEIYGACLGYARETHLRRAIKELYKEGVIAYDGKGNLQRAVIQ